MCHKVFYILIAFLIGCGEGEELKSHHTCGVADIELVRAPIDLMVLSFGQSNSGGAGCNRDALSKKSNVFFFYGGGWSNDHNYRTVGPEAALGARLGAEYPDKNIGILKIAHGGSEIKDWFTGTLFYYEVLGNIRQARRYGGTDGIAGYFWMQGEADSVQYEAAIEYNSNLEYFISSLRDSDAPFVIGLIGTRAFPYVDDVRNAQFYVAAHTPRVYTVETNDLEKHADEVHFTEYGLRILGERFAEKFIEEADTI